MSDNPIVEWYTKEKKLAELLVSIDQQTVEAGESARIAFYKVADLYNLPKFPEDVSDNLYKYDAFEEPSKNTSLFEQLAIHKVMFPESDIRGSVLAACLAIYGRMYYSIEEAAAEYYGTHDHIPEIYHAYFSGNDIDVKLKFSSSFQSKLGKQARLVQKQSKEE